MTAHKGHGNSRRQLRSLGASEVQLRGVADGLEEVFRAGFEKTCTPEIAKQYATSYRDEISRINDVMTKLGAHAVSLRRYVGDDFDSWTAVHNPDRSPVFHYETQGYQPPEHLGGWVLHRPIDDGWRTIPLAPDDEAKAFAEAVEILS